MPKRVDRESRSSSGISPYENTLRKKPRVNYSDAEIFEPVDPGGAVNTAVEVGASEVISNQAAPISPASSSSNSVPKGPINTWVVEGDSLDELSHPQLHVYLNTLLEACTYRASFFNAAIQRFEMYAQFFTSACANTHPDGTTDVVTTLRAATHTANELSPPRRDYIIAVTMVRHFVAGLLHRLPPRNETRERITKVFNEISRAYEAEENSIREDMKDAGGKAEGKLRAYMDAFKRRGEMLRTQRGRLEILARDCLVEIGEEG